MRYDHFSGNHRKHRRPENKPRVADAAAVAQEVRNWTCKTCDMMVEAEGDHCSACTQYWQDVESGVFDDQDYGQEWSDALDHF